MTRSLTCGVSAAVLIASAIVAGGPAAPRAQEATYSVRLLPSLGGTNNRGNSINDAGWIAGYSQLTDSIYRHATLWRGDTLIDLGTLGSQHQVKNSNVAWPVKNTRGRLVGISQTDAPDPWHENWSCSAFFLAGGNTGFRCLGFVWQQGVMRPLPTLGGTHGYAAAANDLGEIVGWAENRARDDSCTPPQVFQFRAVVWGPEGDRIRELPVFGDDSSTAATAINNRGQIVGISGDCDQAIGRGTARHAVLWDHGSVRDIGNFGGRQWNTPTAINERGDIAGFSDHEGEAITEAFIWTVERGFEGLGFLGHDDGLSEAFGMNAHQQVVGLSCGSSCRAFLWQNGTMLDLNGISSVPAGVVLTHAMDINDQGVITGRAFDGNTGRLEAYVATPIGGTHARARDWAPGARDLRHLDAGVPPDTMREILHPFGPHRDDHTARGSQ